MPADAMRQRIIDWCEINSGSHHAEGLARMLSALTESFGELDAKLETLELADGSPHHALHLVCRPEAKTQVLLSGHMDTVYGSDHPFQKCTPLDENRLNGPGTADMKGGLVIMLEALKTFEQHPNAKNLGWEVLISPDEEIGSLGSAPLLDAAAERCQLGLIFEPSLASGELARARLGSATYSVTAQGRASHVGRHYADGRNALIALCDTSLQLQKAIEQLPGAICNLGRIEGGGPLNVVPDAGQASYNIRVGRMEDAASVEGTLQSISTNIEERHGVELQWEGGFTRPPKEISDATESLFESLQSMRSSLGIRTQMERHWWLLRWEQSLRRWVAEPRHPRRPRGAPP